MRALEIITGVNELSPNQYDNELKLRWLRDLDGKIFRELIEGRGDGETEARFTAADYADTDVELLIGEPYARDVYLNYLRSKIAEADAEAERYNFYASVFNAEYQQFAAHYNSKTPPRGQRGWRY
jgi:hypothetical protein